jgi:hypothetical protein
MIIPAYCDKCEGFEFSVDTDLLDFPFHSDMFPVSVDCIHSRTWIFPPGPVNMELTCPGCGGPPFEHRDGVLSGRIKMRDYPDARFLKLVDWTDIKTGTIEQFGIDQFKPGKANNHERRKHDKR